MAKATIERLYPGSEHTSIDELAAIWDEVVQRILDEMSALSVASSDAKLHVNIRGEMVMELVRLQSWLTESVVKERLSARELSTVDPSREREECFGEAGAARITGTAKMANDHIWSKLMQERWGPKSAKALARDEKPKKVKLAVKRVDKNHFVPRWFIRDNWSIDQRIRVWRHTIEGWRPTWAGFGEWGYRHALYSDRLEAYFGLLEGDAKRPIEMLLETYPLNDPQREALVGFLVVQVFRNPRTMTAVQRALGPEIAKLGYGDDPTMPRRAYESLFSNNEFYDAVARPIMWSPWAIIRSEEPIFVLPDTFGARTGGPEGMRLIVPLTPSACFVTLPGTEAKKRVVPYTLKANQNLARRISQALCDAAEKEFLSAPGFERLEGEMGPLDRLLTDISALARD